MIGDIQPTAVVKVSSDSFKIFWRFESDWGVLVGHNLENVLCIWTMQWDSSDTPTMRYSSFKDFARFPTLAEITARVEEVSRYDR